VSDRRSPLHDRHLAAGAKVVPFGGWEMPLQYPTGTVHEHLACRSDSAVFDVSHLGTVRVTDTGAHDRLQAVLTNDLDRIGPGRAQYTHLLDDAGGVLDDLIVWWVGPDEFDVMPNASNTDGVRAAIGGTDVTAERVVLAVQGPRARERVASWWPQAAAVGRFEVARCDWDGVECRVAGTGYTGEDGIEVAAPVAVAGAVWDRILAAGITPAGLGARDTLRLEAALPLHGHELGPGITPLQARLGWVVAWGKPSFRGKASLEAERARGPHRVLRGIATEGRRPPRAECPVLADGRFVGTVTSGNFSPVLGHGIALALVEPAVAIGEVVEIDVRGTALPGRVVAVPFVRPQRSA